MYLYNFIENTYAEIERIPKYIVNSDTSAVILPIFFFNHTSLLRRCTSVESCAYLYLLLLLLSSLVPIGINLRIS